ncbi:MAG: DUF4433 domain-containing protein [Bryobacterales bacterium]|nr:DUF4433 domain-containing protein [Bryobacteraceae bacterium]MDW8353508.1 DUF4433 domain-containing protein [Bryobacterales bacterium]
MKREDLRELQYITPIENVPSILAHGILSHVRAARLAHSSVAVQAMQDRRSKVVVPGSGRRLHEYANLYICGRNPMLYKLRLKTICVLSIDPAVLDLPGVIVTDGNAASAYTRFAAAPDGLNIVDKERTFAKHWTDNDRLEEWRKKAAKCAEVLVPDRVPPRYIQHAYVATVPMKERMDAMNTGLKVYVDGHLFFR